MPTSDEPKNVPMSNDITEAVTNDRIEKGDDKPEKDVPDIPSNEVVSSSEEMPATTPDETMSTSDDIKVESEDSAMDVDGDTVSISVSDTMSSGHVSPLPTTSTIITSPSAEIVIRNTGKFLQLVFYIVFKVESRLFIKNGFFICSVSLSKISDFVPRLLNL